MKRIVFILLLSLSCLFVNGQGLFDQLVNKYGNEEGFSAVQITSDMFDLYLKKKSIEPDDPIFETLKGLENITVITKVLNGKQEGIEKNKKELIKSEIAEYYKDNGFKLFKTDKKSRSELKIFLRKNKEIVESMGLISSNSYSVNLIEMNGDIELSSIASLNKALNIRGLEHLKTFENKEPDHYFLHDFDFPDIDVEVFKIQDNLLDMDSIIEQLDHALEEDEIERIKQDIFAKINYLGFNSPHSIIIGDEAETEYFLNGIKVEFDEFIKLETESIKKIEVIQFDEPDKKTQVKVRAKKNPKGK